MSRDLRKAHKILEGALKKRRWERRKGRTRGRPEVANGDASFWS